MKTVQDDFTKLLNFFAEKLFDWVLWHINLCRLFHAKSIITQLFLFQTVSTHFKYKYSLIDKKHFYFKLFSLFKQF